MDEAMGEWSCRLCGHRRPETKFGVQHDAMRTYMARVRRVVMQMGYCHEERTCMWCLDRVGWASDLYSLSPYGGRTNPQHLRVSP